MDVEHFTAPKREFPKKKCGACTWFSRHRVGVLTQSQASWAQPDPWANALSSCSPYTHILNCTLSAPLSAQPVRSTRMQ
ncbi:predicted protein [Plenodomus lingam JN3]|uniref:Predicted protein n=1 Tax=Leptosphaeria maculans (strain JN3 / isolate v23.1.3 / race Av1-4-5-6-7-8) TaxID=985895 RepID=E4ZU32_LEPMJ|nr:predicted protein [Plenodomus lingam JN3]CBX94742.1 predicted protein [Plenodomus lingam JN3]